MKFQGAVVNAEGTTFAIIVVRPATLQSAELRQEAIRRYNPIFPGVPIILMAQDPRGRARWYGRPELVSFLSTLKLHQIPWKQYTL